MPRALPSIDPAARPVVSRLDELGRFIRSERARQRLRIDDAAALCHLSSAVLSRAENGKPVTSDNLLRLLDGLGMSLLIVPKRQVEPLEALAKELSIGKSPGSVQEGA